MPALTAEQVIAHFEDKKRAYLLAFGTDAGKIALDDLRPFCRARETCVVPGARDATFVLEGRREVWLRIQDFLDRPVEQLVAIYAKPIEGETNG